MTSHTDTDYYASFPLKINYIYYNKDNPDDLFYTFDKNSTVAISESEFREYKHARAINLSKNASVCREATSSDLLLLAARCKDEKVRNRLKVLLKEKLQ